MSFYISNKERKLIEILLIKSGFKKPIKEKDKPMCKTCGKVLSERGWKFCSTKCSEKDYYRRHKKERIEYSNKYKLRREKIDLNYLIRNRLRTRLYLALRFNRIPINKSWYNVLDYKMIVKHLGNKPEGNYHIDHIVPICLFDLTNIEEIKVAFHYLNLRWLPAEENMNKKAKITIMNKNELISLINLIPKHL